MPGADLEAVCQGSPISVTAVTVLSGQAGYYKHMENATYQSCSECALRPERLFCDLPADALEAFDALKNTLAIPRDTVIFREGQTAREVFVVCEGRVRLTVCSDDGKRLLLRVAESGEVLGLSAALSGTPHEITAQAMEPCQIAMVRRKDLVAFLRSHREACMQVVGLLSEDLHVAYDRVRSVGLGRARKVRVAP
jgi:CRP/FNR family transcriptional regulator, cyclic AMP receptor protein